MPTSAEMLMICTAKTEINKYWIEGGLNLCSADSA